MDELVRFLFGQPTAVAELLARHVDDGGGHCQACRIGAQRGSLTWPCALHDAATRAAEARTAAGLPLHPPRLRPQHLPPIRKGHRREPGCRAQLQSE